MTALTKPVPGLVFEAEFISVRDADTITLKWTWSGQAFAIRLLDVWAPELRRGADQDKLTASDGRDFVRTILKGSREILVHIPKPQKSLLSAINFDRLLGYVWCDGKCLNELIVSKGYASSTQHGKLGE